MSTATKTIAELFGDAPLCKADGSKETAKATELLAGKKYVALYFSAHWCGPCRQFTPIFGDVYKAVKARSADDFEVVFVSADQDEGDFNEYRATMPWLALDPFNVDDVSDELRQHFKCTGFPTVVIIDGATGKLLAEDAVQDIAGDRTAKNFPWVPKSLKDILADDVPLVGASHKTKAKSIGELRVAGVKGIALYFSAHWCPPCRQFTPKLAETYQALAATDRTDFEFIFVTSDRDKESFEEYHETMGFAALPFGNDAGPALKKALGVNGIPMLATVDISGDEPVIVNGKARSEVMRDPEGARFPWVPLPPPAVIQFQPNEETIEAFDKDIAVIDARGMSKHAGKQVMTTLEGIIKAAAGTSPTKVQMMVLLQEEPETAGEKPPAYELFGRVVQFTKCDVLEGKTGMYMFSGLRSQPQLLKTVEVASPDEAGLKAAFDAAQA